MYAEHFFLENVHKRHFCIKFIFVSTRLFAHRRDTKNKQKHSTYQDSKKEHEFYKIKKYVNL
jgi:hypothetical protein